MPATDRLRSALADRYAIERELGAGGMATVYLARDLKHDREVALKVLRADLSAMIGTERFLAEVRIAAKLDHPHILTLIDSGSADGILYYVLPYVRGESLRAMLDREKQLGVEDAVSIITQVASALDYAHAQGVVHRDIKPENILLHQGEAVLADFGIALAMKEASGNRMTETGLSLGTPQYMSPEQATGDRSLDRRSDIYSLGAVFYEMIAGEAPHSGATAQAVIAKLLTEKPVKLRVVRETIPIGMERATEKALAKVPADRFGSAGEFVRALSAAAPEERSSRSRSKLFWPAVAIAALAVIAVTVMIRQSKPARAAHEVVLLRDRTQITNSGRVKLPAISDDGKTIAYVVTDCGTGGCRYGVEMQDIGVGSTRKILEGATAIYGLEISPDRRNLLMNGTIGGVYGAFIVPTLGGPARRLLSGATFWAGGDSLLLTRAVIPGTPLWILVGGLDGVPVDSIRVEGPGESMGAVIVVPGSQRIIYFVNRAKTSEMFSVDRSGKRFFSMSFPRGSLGAGLASSDALWMEEKSPRSPTQALVRIAFDATTGKLSDHADTVYTGNPTSFGVTGDGKTLVLDEGTTEYSGWAMTFDEMLKGNFDEAKRVARSTVGFGFGVSPDGTKMLLGTPTGANGFQDWSVKPFGGGQDTHLGRHASVWYVDSTLFGVMDPVANGRQVSLFDYRTRKTGSVLTIPDSNLVDIARLGPDSWMWIPQDGRSINVQRDGDPRVQKFRIPKWYQRVYIARGSHDGRSVAFTGWKAPDEDSVGMGILSVPDDRFSQTWVTFAESAAQRWLNDGSLQVEVWDTPESVSFYRYRLGGPIQRIGSVPRAIRGLSMSRDGKRVLVTARDYHGDAFMSKVVK